MYPRLFFLINKTLLNKKILHNPIKREAEPYIKGSKGDIRHGTRPYKESSKTVQQKDNTKFNNNKNYNNNNNNKQQ